ncbi:MAG: hypothetical protein K2H70_06380, partial [Bacteroidales bacterium]|nr:hypothetical protein [Bacteroidales bacterium]
DMGFDGVPMAGSGYRVLRSFSLGLKSDITGQTIKIQTYEKKKFFRLNDPYGFVMSLAMAMYGVRPGGRKNADAPFREAHGRDYERHDSCGFLGRNRIYGL